MGLKAGIVGLPNVGKSTLFNAITKKNILAANYPFATIEPNVGVVFVPDERLDKLNDLYKPEKLVPTSFEFIDIAGLVKGASKGEGLGNKFLSHIREVDAIVEVVRCFDDGNVIHVEDGIDPVRDIEIINLELTLADLEVISNRAEKIKKKADSTKDKEALKEYDALKKAKVALELGQVLRKVDFSKEEIELLKTYAFLTMKPVIYLANVSEEELSGNEYVNKVKEYANNEGSETIIICAKIEAELCDLDEVDKLEMLSSIGATSSGLDQVIKATYSLLGLRTYFTSGVDECRAWTFKAGMNAKECAGIIHSDFEKGFIRAEVMTYDDLITCGSELKVKEAGKARLEGKEYLMQDGDICYFRFNV
jgi:GTP-binding protein YchF